MSDSIRIEIPASLGLSDDDINRLSEAFRTQLAGTMNSSTQSQAQPGVRARPQTVVQSRPQTTIKEVPQVVEVK